MQSVSLEELKSQLGNWVELPEIDTITLKAEKESGVLYNDIDNPGNEFRVFARPNGLQLSPGRKIAGKRHYAIPYADIQSVEPMPSTAVFYKEASGIFYVFIFGLLFYIVGNVFGDRGLGLTWLPSGLVFGLLISIKHVKQEKRQILQIMLNDAQSLKFSIAKDDKNKVMDFFLHHLEDKFRF